MTARNERVIRSFEPKDDVARMLNRARARGIKFTFLINSALREYLVKAGYGRKKDLS